MPLSSQIPPPDYRRMRSLVSLPNNQIFDLQNGFMAALGQMSTPYTLSEAAEETLVFKAVEYITNTILGMPWEIVGTDAEDRAEQIRDLTYALQRPNGDYANTYKKMVSAIAFDLLRYGVAAIERQPRAFDDGQAFYLWVVDPTKVQVNNDWTADRAGIEPRYYIRKLEAETSREVLAPVLDENLFLILPRVHSDRLIPTPPLQIAYETIKTWRKLYNFQSEVAANASRNTLLHVEGGLDDDVIATRQFLRNEMEGQGGIPVIGGDAVKVLKIGSSTDEGLFLKLAEYLIGLIGLVFGISRQNMGIPESVGLNSGGVAETATSSSYQNGVKPLAMIIVEGLNQEVVQFFGGTGVCLQLVDTEPRGEVEEAIARDKEADTLTKYVAAGIIDVEEARAKAGFAPRKKSKQPKGDVNAII